MVTSNTNCGFFPSRAALCAEEIMAKLVVWDIPNAFAFVIDLSINAPL